MSRWGWALLLIRCGHAVRGKVRGSHPFGDGPVRCALSLYDPHGALYGWCVSSWLKWSEGVDGIRRPRDWQESLWRYAQVDRQWRAASAREANLWRQLDSLFDREPEDEDEEKEEALCDALLQAADDRIDLTRRGFRYSMRGRGARKRAFQAHLKRSRISTPCSRNGRPSLFRTAAGLVPDLEACLADAAGWLDHLREAMLKTKQRPLDHVMASFYPEGLLEDFLQGLAQNPRAFANLLDELEREATHAAEAFEIWSTALFFRDVLVAALTAEEKLKDRSVTDWLWDHDRWSRHRPTIARHILASLSDGRVTARQIRDHTRHQG